MSTIAGIPSCTSRRTRGTLPGHGSVSLASTLRNGLYRLREGEHAIGVIGALDLGEPTEVSTVVGLLPVGQGGVDVVLVGLAARVRAHRLPERLLPRVLTRHPGRRRTYRPGGRVLRLKQRVAVHERGRARCDAVDGAAERVEGYSAGPARRAAHPLQALHAGQQGADPLAAQRLGDEVGL